MPFSVMAGTNCTLPSMMDSSQKSHVLSLQIMGEKDATSRNAVEDFMGTCISESSQTATSSFSLTTGRMLRIVMSETDIQTSL